MELGRLHLAQTRPQSTHGQPHRPVLQLVESLCEVLRRRAPPRSHSHPTHAHGGVGRQVQSGGQRTVKVSVLHEKGDPIAQAVTQISTELHQIRAITERWSVDQRWMLLLTRLLRRWPGRKWLRVHFPFQATARSKGLAILLWDVRRIEITSLSLRLWKTDFAVL